MDSIKNTIENKIENIRKIPWIKTLFSPKAKKISSWLILGFLSAVLIFILFPLLPIEDNYSLKIVLSGSMEPAIKTGGIVMVKPASEYQTGDIITYQYGRHARDLTTHRIIEQQGNEFITKGDNNNAADIQPVEKEQILGKVLLTVPYVGYAANFARSKLGFILLIIIPALFIIESESLKIFREVKKMRQQKNNIFSKTKNEKVKSFTLLILLAGLSTFSFIGSVNCYFSDSVVLENNHFQAGEWVPVLGSIGDKTLEAESSLEFTISATDPNDDALTYSASILPEGANFTGQTFSWIPTSGQVGTYSNILFEVSDSKYTDSENITITVVAIPPPEISNVEVKNITQNSAKITWQTDQLATSKVEYGETTDYGSVSGNSTPVASHTISISGLATSTTYHYRVSSKNKADKEQISGDHEFTTSG
jgi:signal peptidase